MAKRVTQIPAVKNRYSAAPLVEAKKRRVAGYARVSTELEEQQSSYDAQMNYYSEFIQSHCDWEFVGMYSDEGITGTSTAHRDGFNQMVEDALNGKIDLIITKSVSRFARNTVDSLTTIRQLKDKGIEVYFEKENIWTFDAKGELLITIMSSLAQEESRSISENTTWGQRRRFADGKASVGYSKFLGYDKGFVVNKKEAKTVRLIYKLFLEGYSCYAIAKELTKRGVPTVTGKAVWNATTVKSILTNEKYKGDALLQKEYTVDFLTKKRKKNEGEIPQYYVEGDHEAIIEPEVFDLVQMEMARRFQGNSRYSGVSIFSSKIKCGECGCWYGPKVWHSNDKYRRVVYRCNHKYKGEKVCRTPRVTEDEVKEVFVHAVNVLLAEKDELAANAQIIVSTLCDCTELEEQRSERMNELRDITDMMEHCVSENARVVQDQGQYNEHYNELIKRYDTTKEEYDRVTQKIADKTARKNQLEVFLRTIREQGPIEEFDEELWASLVDYVTVYSKSDIRVTFRDGTEI